MPGIRGRRDVPPGQPMGGGGGDRGRTCAAFARARNGSFRRTADIRPDSSRRNRLRVFANPRAVRHSRRSRGSRNRFPAISALAPTGGSHLPGSGSIPFVRAGVRYRPATPIPHVEITKRRVSRADFLRARTRGGHFRHGRRPQPRPVGGAHGRPRRDARRRRRPEGGTAPLHLVAKGRENRTAGAPRGRPRRSCVVRCGQSVSCPEPDLNRHGLGQRGLSSPCLHSTIRAGRSGSRTKSTERCAEPIRITLVSSGPSIRCCLILLALEGSSGPRTRGGPVTGGDHP